MTRLASHACLGMVMMALLSSCASRLACDSDVPRVRLAKGPVRSGASEEERINALLPKAPPGVDFTITRVDHLQPQPACGISLFITVYTLGIVPSAVPANYLATVTGTCKGRTETRRYQVYMESQYSIWHTLIPPSRDDRILTRALLHAVARDRRVDSSGRPLGRQGP